MEGLLNERFKFVVMLTNQQSHFNEINSIWVIIFLSSGIELQGR